MALYEYQCDNCGNVEEEIREVDDRNNLKSCTKCDSVMRKLINAPAAIVFPFKLNAISSSGRKIPGKFHT